MLAAFTSIYMDIRIKDIRYGDSILSYPIKPLRHSDFFRSGCFLFL